MPDQLLDQAFGGDWRLVALPLALAGFAACGLWLLWEPVWREWREERRKAQQERLSAYIAVGLATGQSLPADSEQVELRAEPRPEARAELDETCMSALDADECDAFGALTPAEACDLSGYITTLLAQFQRPVVGVAARCWACSLLLAEPHPCADVAECGGAAEAQALSAASCASWARSAYWLCHTHRRALLILAERARMSEATLAQLAELLEVE